MKIKILILLITINLITMTATAQLAESYHPYAANFAYTWPAITEPGATQMRLHFTKVELTWGSVLKIQNANGKTLATIDNFQADLNLKNLKEDFWTDWFTTDTLKVRLETDKYGGSYGFLIDQKETRKSMAPSTVTTTPPSTNTPTYTNAPPPTSTPRFTPIQALTPSPQDSFETEPTNTPIYTNVPSTISTPRFTPIQAPYSWQDNMWLYIVVTLIIGIITEKIIRRR